LLSAFASVGQASDTERLTPFISASAALPLSTAVARSLCRIALTIALACGMARFNFSGRLLCGSAAAFRLSDLYAL
jgi:hypothetical protein